LSEGMIGGRHHVESIAPCVGEDGLPAPNIVNILPTDRTLLDPARWRRNTYASSSCGLCGKVSIEQVVGTEEGRRTKNEGWDRHEWTVGVGVFYSLEERLSEAQAGFSLTGGLHAAGLFDLEGSLIVVREDVGRHNAVDKVIGYGLMQNMLPLDRHILLVSSRASFEIVQKARAAGIRAMAVLSAPSSLAVDLARESGMTLVAFLRNGRMNVYSGEERLRR
jgi:FdhD protein